jgi:hypothetical protein
MAPEEKAPYKATITLKGTKPEHIATALNELQHRIAEFDQTGEGSATVTIEAHQEEPIQHIVEAYETWLFYHAPGLDCEVKLKRPGLRPETRELLAREKRRTPMDSAGWQAGETTPGARALGWLERRESDQPVSSDAPPTA